MQTLAELANLVNGTSVYASGAKNCSGKTIVLTADVDLTAICAANIDSDGNGGWNPIGSFSKKFAGTFNGNGHKVRGLYIKRTGTNYQGLFGFASGELKNIGIEGGNVTGKNYTGGLAGYARIVITNSYSSVNITGNDYTGGLAGCANNTITNSYATGTVTGNKYVGGFAGYTTTVTSVKVSNCYALGEVIASDERAGGLIGWAEGEVENCYAQGRVSSEKNYSGGLIGYAEKAVTNSYVTGNVAGNNQTGGLVGYAKNAITNSYAVGIVTGNNTTGGLVGYAGGAVTDSYATGKVIGNDSTGGLAGYAKAITNSYATGNVAGNDRTGGLVGFANNAITNSYATGNVTGNDRTGGLAGVANSVTNSYATGSITGNDYTGGLVGYAANAVTNSYATGNTTGNDYIGGLAGLAVQAITNSYATGNVTGHDYTGGFLGSYDGSSIDTCYSRGKVSGNNSIGGFIGKCGEAYYGVNINISDSVSYSKVSGNEIVGSFIGNYTRECDDFGDVYVSELDLSGCTSANLSDYNMIGGCYKYYAETEEFEEITEYDLTPLLAQIDEYNLLPSDIDIQCGINSDRSSRINFDTNFSYSLNISDLTSDSAYTSITEFLNKLSQKSTELGAAQNRLESALESTMVQMDNLTSSLSTIRDADIGEVSSAFIRQQILQQACATLMSTANQSPAIALQLI